MRTLPAARARGFTLIELMIVVTIIAVLLAIAVPAYRDAVRNTRRAVAQTCLEEGAQFMERFYTTHLQYHQTRATPAVAVALPGCSEDITEFYTIRLDPAAPPTASTFALQAVPRGDQLNEKCGTLSLDNTGAREHANAEATDCWR